MKRLMMLAAVLALSAAPAAFAASSSAPPAGPYKLDANKRCHAANGQIVATSLCAAPAATSSHPPKCTTGVPCGNTCIAKGKVCHKT